MPRTHLKQRSDGRYACRYKDQWFMGSTEREALQAREAYKLKQKQGLRKDNDKITVRDYAAAWLPVHKHGADKRTYNDCAKQLNVMIDQIGDKRMCDVTPSDIKKVWAYYEGYSESMIRHTYQLYNGMFDTAAEEGYILRNPVKSKHAEPPKGTSGTHRAITDEERELILNHRDHPFAKAVMTMLYAGLRRGESLALDIDRDVDFKKHRIHVQYAVRFESNQPIVDDPKTEAGERYIPMTAILQSVLKGSHGLLAPSQTNTVMSESAFNSAWNGYVNYIESIINGHQKRWHHRTKNDPIRPLVEKLQAEGKHEQAEELRLRDWIPFTVRTHDFRHSYCTMLRDAGVDIKLAMKWMGHADEKMILRIYDHITDSRQEMAMADVEKLIKRRQNGRQNKRKVVKSA